MGRVELSFVLPAYNEAESIGLALDSLHRVAKDMDVRFEILVVDDGSMDCTCMRAADYASQNEHVRIVSYRPNIGKGFALKTGFMQASGDAVVFVDSDMEIDVEQVGYYVEALRWGDLVVASKGHPNSLVDVPLLRRILSFGFNALVRFLTGVSLRDTQTGLKAIRKEALEFVFPRLSVKRYAFDVELLTVANVLGLKVVEMPVNIRMKGLFRLRDVWGMFMDLLGITYRLRVLRWYQRSLPIRHTAP